MATVEERLAAIEARFAIVDQREAQKAARDTELARTRAEGFAYLRGVRTPPVDNPREPVEETPPRGVR